MRSTIALAMMITSTKSSVAAEMCSKRDTLTGATEDEGCLGIIAWLGLTGETIYVLLNIFQGQHGGWAPLMRRFEQAVGLWERLENGVGNCDKAGWDEDWSLW